MGVVRGIEGNDLRRSLGARPEGVAGGVCVIIREEGLKIANRVVKVGIEDITGLLNDSVDITRLLESDKLGDIGKLRAHASGCSVLTEGSDEGFGSSKELNSILYARAEERVELVTAPFDTMLDLVREVS